MNPNAIVYTSNTGYTRQYAMLLGEKTGLPVYSLEEAVEKLPAGNCILYLGWLMAGKVQGYAKAARRYRVQAVCGVGMGETGSQIQDLRKANRLSPSMPVFTVQGGFDPDRLGGVYKLMIQTAGKGLKVKKNRSPEEEAMLALLHHGGSYVSEENLEAVLGWYRKLIGGGQEPCVMN